MEGERPRTTEGDGPIAAEPDGKGAAESVGPIAVEPDGKRAGESGKEGCQWPLSEESWLAAVSR